MTRFHHFVELNRFRLTVDAIDTLAMPKNCSHLSCMTRSYSTVFRATPSPQRNATQHKCYQFPWRTWNRKKRSNVGRRRRASPKPTPMFDAMYSNARWYPLECDRRFETMRSGDRCGDAWQTAWKTFWTEFIQPENRFTWHGVNIISHVTTLFLIIFCHYSFLPAFSTVKWPQHFFLYRKRQPTYWIMAWHGIARNEKRNPFNHLLIN